MIPPLIHQMLLRFGKALFEPSAWIAAVLLFAGGSLMIESIKSGGLQQDVERIRSFFVEKLGEKSQAADTARLEQRRREWMEKYQIIKQQNHLKIRETTMLFVFEIFLHAKVVTFYGDDCKDCRS